MGISGLLPLLKPVTKVNHISSYKNKRIAIDGYAWLHKAVYGCCLELATGVDSDKWVLYCLKLIDMLLFNQIIVHMVFDGANLPAKNVTEEARAANRAKYLASGLKLIHSTDRNDQISCRSDLVKAIDVTPRMAGQLIKVLRETRPEVLCTVAPYEADAQLAYLCREGCVDAVIAEDSDTVPYGCKEMIFKLSDNGDCETIILADIYSTPMSGFDLRGFTPDMMIALCVGAGCDYLKSLKGFGIKTSYKHISKCRSAEKMLGNMRLTGNIPLIPARIKNIPQKNLKNTSCDNIENSEDVRVLNGEQRVRECTVENNVRTSITSNVPLEYEVAFHKAVATFKHQTIFDLKTRKTRHLTPIIESQMPAMLGHLFNGNSIKNIAGAGNSNTIDDVISVEKSSKHDIENDNDNDDNDNNNVNNMNDNNSCGTIDYNDSSSNTNTNTNNNNNNNNTSSSNTEGVDYSGFLFLGALLPDDVACAVADGTMDPITLTLFDFTSSSSSTTSTSDLRKSASNIGKGSYTDYERSGSGSSSSSSGSCTYNRFYRHSTGPFSSSFSFSTSSSSSSSSSLDYRKGRQSAGSIQNFFSKKSSVESTSTSTLSSASISTSSAIARRSSSARFTKGWTECSTSETAEENRTVSLRTAKSKLKPMSNSYIESKPGSKALSKKEFELLSRCALDCESGHALGLESNRIGPFTSLQKTLENSDLNAEDENKNDGKLNTDELHGNSITQETEIANAEYEKERRLNLSVLYGIPASKIKKTTPKKVSKFFRKISLNGDENKNNEKIEQQKNDYSSKSNEMSSVNEIEYYDGINVNNNNVNNDIDSHNKSHYNDNNSNNDSYNTSQKTNDKFDKSGQLRNLDDKSNLMQFQSNSRINHENQKSNTLSRTYDQFSFQVKKDVKSCPSHKMKSGFSSMTQHTYNADTKKDMICNNESGNNNAIEYGSKNRNKNENENESENDKELRTELEESGRDDDNEVEVIAPYQSPFGHTHTYALANTNTHTNSYARTNTRTQHNDSVKRVMTRTEKQPAQKKRLVSTSKPFSRCQPVLSPSCKKGPFDTRSPGKLMQDLFSFSNIRK